MQSRIRLAFWTSSIVLASQHPQVFFLRAALTSFSSQPVFVLGIAPPHVQGLALDLVELHEVCTGPVLQPVKVPLDGIPPLQRVECTKQLGVFSKLAEGALNATVHVTDKDVKQCWSLSLISKIILLLFQNILFKMNDNQYFDTVWEVVSSLA